MDRRAINEAELETVDGYRKLSPFAIVSFALGVLSPLAFTAPFLLCVPLLAIFAAIVALLSIRARPEQLAGKTLARCGLALAICFAGAAIVRTQTTAYLFHKQAFATAEAWVHKLAEGKFEEAISYLSPMVASRLLPQPEKGEPLLSREEARAFLANILRESPLGAFLRKHSETLSFEQVSPTTAPETNKSGRTVSALYRIDSSSGPSLLLSLQLSTSPAGYELPLRIDHWEVIESSR